MTKKKQVIVNVSQNWIQISSKTIEQFIAENKQLDNNKRIRTNISICLYILYDLLYKRHVNENLHLNYYSINYHSLKLWSQMSYNFPKFFRFLLDKNILKRWQSQTINKKTGKPFAYYYHSKGVAGVSAKYKFNNAIIKALENQPEVAVTLDVSQKNDYFFHTVSKAKKKLNWWKNNDVYNDYREPNEYELKIMQRMKHIQIADELVEGEIDPVFIHGRIYQNGWTNLSKDFRKTVKYKDQLMDEIFDVRNCYVQFTAAMLEECGQVDQAELKLFCDKAYSGKFYQFLAEGTEYTRNDMKTPWMHYLFSNNQTKKRGIANQRDFVDGKAINKFDQDYIARWNVVKNKMIEHFSSIHKFLYSYPQIEVEGRKVSKLSVDLQWIENKYVLNGLMRMLEQKGKINEPISLHDAIYLTVDQVTEQMKSFMQDCWKNILNKHIRKVTVKPEVKPIPVALQVKTPVKSERETIRKWLVETNTSAKHMKQFDEDKNMYDLFKIAYEYGTGQIKSTREILGGKWK